MFTSCPHCRELVATDRQTLLAPVLCPRCGGEMREPGTEVSPVDESKPAVGRSFVSFLQANKETASADSSEVDPTKATETPAVEPQVQSETVAASFESILIEPLSEAIAADGYNNESLTNRDVADEPEPSLADASAGILADQAIVATEPGATDPTPAIQTTPPVTTPSFTRQPASITTPPRTAKWQWATLAVLSLLLILQVLIADRARLAADENWRPVITRLCDALGCAVPAWHQPGAFAMLSRDVRPIAGTPGGLQVQATFRNDAQWSQAWPLLLLSLSDADGRVVGARAFTPAEYLGKAAVTQPALAPGQSAGIALQLHEPNPDVVAFSFDFR